MLVSHRRRVSRAACVESLESRVLYAAGDTFFVSLKGSDANPGDAAHPWRTIQQAMNAATPGSTVNVLPGRYNEKVSVNVSGNATDGFITFQAAGRGVIISGFRKAGPDIIFINNQNYVRILGFDVRDDYNVNNGSGIRITSGGDHIVIQNNRIHLITGISAMGITAYGSEPTRPISNLVVDHNEIFACFSAPSETLTLNGNVNNFTVTNNFIHNVLGIGIDFISGEGICPDPANDIAHDGVCAGNRVLAAHVRGSRDTAGIWVDGSQNILVEHNITELNDVGIEVGCVNPALVTRNITVRSNYVALNRGAGISIGGSDQLAGQVQNCRITNNTVLLNDLSHAGAGEVRLQFASNNTLENNLILAHPGGLLIKSESDAANNASDYNLLFSGLGVRRSPFQFGGTRIAGFSAYQAASGQEQHSIFALPVPLRFVNGTLHITSKSRAVNAGDPAFTGDVGETDIDGDARVLGGRVDIGDDEVA
ncbi:MAG TPA: right-handed parallel beta-helix repeat-containing protein [Tepidisphaeraceae bacterium]|nr:right-handed parallel beta-helix repeat-containing protein [Tepidisphaeraceae bacterium]